MARQPIGHDAETDLFLWAESGFPLAERSTGHAELKAAVDHFWANPEFRDPLSRRMTELEHLRPSLEDEVARMQTGMSTLRGVVNVFQREETERRREAPLFLTYNLAPRDSQAGANGEGLYAEVDLSSSSKAVLHTQLLHEYLHLALRPRRRFRALAATPAQQDWQRALLSTALDERGDDEAAMLDEILVHALADVIVAGHDPWDKMRDYALLGDKQRVRMWDGVRILLPIVRGQIERPLPSQEFLSQMIGAFLGQVHHLVWSCPPGITIAAKPSAG